MQEAVASAFRRRVQARSRCGPLYSHAHRIVEGIRKASLHTVVHPVPPTLSTPIQSFRLQHLFPECTPCLSSATSSVAWPLALPRASASSPFRSATSMTVRHARPSQAYTRLTSRSFHRLCRPRTLDGILWLRRVLGVQVGRARWSAPRGETGADCCTERGPYRCGGVMRILCGAWCVCH